MTFSTVIHLIDGCVCDSMNKVAISTPPCANKVNDLEQRKTNLDYDFHLAVGTDEIGSGATSRVCVADVPTSTPGRAGLASNTRMALKMVAATSERSFRRETDALKTLEGVSKVVRCYASFAFQPPGTDLSREENVEGQLDFLKNRRPQTKGNSAGMANAHLIFLEYLEHGDLFTLLIRYPNGLPVEPARAYCHEVCACISACHAHGVQHRDIKPENLLVASDGTLRLADFGNSLVGYHTAASDFCGTAAYLAPEVGTGAQYDPRAADVWSAGVVCFVILLGVPPFHEANANCWYFRCVRDRKWSRFWAQHDETIDRVSPGARRFIERALDVVPERRPSANELLADPYLASLPETDLSCFVEPPKQVS